MSLSRRQRLFGELQSPTLSARTTSATTCTSSSARRRSSTSTAARTCTRAWRGCARRTTAARTSCRRTGPRTSRPGSTAPSPASSRSTSTRSVRGRFHLSVLSLSPSLSLPLPPLRAHSINVAARNLVVARSRCSPRGTAGVRSSAGAALSLSALGSFPWK